ncbi:MAG: thiamine ABC transporter substrate-binding protein [Acidimicrobiia bacterium]|jgi:thiamine transport system substrate-binding protein
MRRATTAVGALVLSLAACSPGTPSGPEVLTIIAHDSFAGGVSNETFASFTAQTGVEVRVLQGGDAGLVVNQAILTKDNPVADVLFGVDDTFLSRALTAGIFVPYRSPLLETVPAELQLDPEHRVTPIDFGDVCLNYDKAAMAAAGIEPPSSLDDLLDPAYLGLLAVQNPGTSSPGLAFLLATIDRFGEPGWQEFWRGLVANDVNVAGDWDAAYYGAFTRYGGDRPIVVSYASSPPAEVIFAEEPLDEAPTGVVLDGCYRQVEFAGILAGTEHQEAAERLVDFMLSQEFQEGIPLTWFVFPANSEATLPPEFVEHTSIAPDPAGVDPEAIDANRERWIEEWNRIVLP